jgi:hypothetical protein
VKYPVGTIIQVFPFEAMVKRGGGFNHDGGGWEFFNLEVAPGGTRIAGRTQNEQEGKPLRNLFGRCEDIRSHGACQVKAYDRVCEGHLPRLSFTDAEIEALRVDRAARSVRLRHVARASRGGQRAHDLPHATERQRIMPLVRLEVHAAAPSEGKNSDRRGRTGERPGSDLMSSGPRQVANARYLHAQPHRHARLEHAHPHVSDLHHRHH